MGGPALDFDDLRPGSILGPFDLLLPIGEGGMARVWAARVRASGQVVALKMLLPDLAENPSFQQMFFDEARIASRVRHANVCATYELGQYEGIWCLVMEWVDGPSLMRILRPGPEVDNPDAPKIPVHPRLAARIVAEMCNGLHAAHETLGDDGRPLHVVHRDVSPHNVLVTSAGEIKMTDFGVAKALGKSNVTMAGQIKGKLAYMAPEQLMGGGIDRRADVFALGCVLYEITTGQKPFQGEHDPQIMTAIVLGRYELPSTIMPNYPAELEDIIITALANEPEQRYPTADHMRYALETWLHASGPPVAAGQIVALLRERVGDDLEARHRALYGAHPSISPGAPPRMTAAETGSGGAITVDHAGSQQVDRRPTAALAVAALFGAAVGVAILSYVHAHRKPRIATRLEAPIASSAPVWPAPPPIPSPPGSIAILPPRRVRLHVDPPSATMIVDGAILPAGTDTLSRPEDGGTFTVLFRADKHDDTIVLVDANTPDEVEVALLPTTAPVKRLVMIDGGGRARDSGAAAASSSPPIDAPPNPYE